MALSQYPQRRLWALKLDVKRHRIVEFNYNKKDDEKPVPLLV